jgi:HD-GYP domain-containing protein (c-di-GMP phosphodiesterase class II)
MAELKSKAGTQFDPDLVQIFEKNIFKNMKKL